ncbi:hypothetical protein F4604DRAFT_1964931 [Suillus subluteus]|nr:hypothetical protein F4604DRAFT_1964931 [Suillus subluteus]
MHPFAAGQPMAGPTLTLTITKSVTGVITCATKPPQDMVTCAALALQRILQCEYGDSYKAGKYTDPVVEIKLRNPMLAEFSPTDALVSFHTQFKAYIKDEDPFNWKMRTNESALGWWKALQKTNECTMSTITWLDSPRRSRQEFGTLQDHIKIQQWHCFDSNKLKTLYKPLIKWRDMESTILGKHPAEDLPPAG